jgi:Sulfotransferase family
VQRVLATHPEIATAAEPWVALPQLYATRGSGVYAEYGYGPSTRAIREFTDTLPGGNEAYQAEVRAFLLRVYALAGGSATYFLDKTPRYDLVASELLELFPESRAIVLWRNPLAVVSSIVETWAGGRWTFGRWNVDLHEGLDRLVTAAVRYADRVHAVRFEDLVGRPGESWPELFGYLGLPYDPSVLSAFAGTRLDARMGDPSGSREYTELSTEPLSKWKRTFSNSARKAWARRYLGWIGRERLTAMGYDLDELLEHLNEIPTGAKGLLSDTWRSAYGRAIQRRRDRALHRLTKRGRW